MRAYELRVILDGDLDEPVAQRWIKIVNDQVKAAGGQAVGQPDWWGKRRFAYEINKKDEGYYVVFNVVAPPGSLDELERQPAPRGRGRPPQAHPPARPRGRSPRHGRAAGRLKGRTPSWHDSTVTLVGNLTRDPELRFTQAGQAVATLGIAVSRRYQQNGEWQEKTSFFNVTAWGQLGENAASSLTKGARVIVTGRLEQRSYETQDGEKRSVVEVVADEIGPSLRWATAQVERNDRREGGGRARLRPGPAPARVRLGSRGGGARGPQYDDNADEEPF